MFNLKEKKERKRWEQEEKKGRKIPGLRFMESQVSGKGELITKGSGVLCVDDDNWKFTRYNWQRGMNTKQPNPSVWLEPKLMLAATPVHIYSFSLFLFPERDDFEVIWGLGV